MILSNILNKTFKQDFYQKLTILIANTKHLKGHVLKSNT